jgi:biopolymer transport protein ExbD
MKVDLRNARRVRIEMIPIMDCMFLLLVFFVYGMLTMAIHRGIPVLLPTSSTARVEKELILSVTVGPDGATYLDKEKIPLENLAQALKQKTAQHKESGVLLFADKNLPYQKLLRVLDQIRTAGLSRISLQAEEEQER